MKSHLDELDQSRARGVWAKPELRVIDVKELTSGSAGTGNDNNIFCQCSDEPPSGFCPLSDGVDRCSNVPLPSDARLKRDIEHVATREDGLRVYAFRYLWDDAVHVGVMAQDLLRNEAWQPSVSSENGYYAVDYGRLGLRMTTLDEWNAKGMNALEA